MSALLSVGAIHSLLRRLWERFYPSEPCPPELYLEVRQYMENSDQFESLKDACERLDLIAVKDVRDITSLFVAPMIYIQNCP